MAKKEEFTSLHPNGLSFVSKGTGRNGKVISQCKLNLKKFVTIKSPTYHDGMGVEEARAAWTSYVRSFQPKKYPTIG